MWNKIFPISKTLNSNRKFVKKIIAIVQYHPGYKDIRCETYFQKLFTLSISQCCIICKIYIWNKVISTNMISVWINNLNEQSRYISKKSIESKKIYHCKSIQLLFRNLSRNYESIIDRDTNRSLGSSLLISFKNSATIIERSFCYLAWPRLKHLPTFEGPSWSNRPRLNNAGTGKWILIADTLSRERT